MPFIFTEEKKEIDAFQELLNDSIKANSGTIFLVQGSPGAGKSALLKKCGEIAAKQGWEVVESDADIFWNVKKTSESIKNKFQYRIRQSFRHIKIR